ncbi:polysaccharide deacetylase family protein [Treponema pectinovorum]|uniref:polysaccharide deacetylase family protein n=1 Tax=Treponema pectinovorum TaxID=164 RepID=UPI0011F33284|nr:polysaccharide deacetylase family protein [Treponema pectinovorum]
MIKAHPFKFRAIFAFIFFYSVCFLRAEISFENPSVNSSDKILFSVKNSNSHSYSYSTAFMGDAKSLSDTKILTCYPEKLDMLLKGEVLQIRNRWGLARWSVADNNLSWLLKPSSIPENSQRQVEYSTSPDGRWYCYIKKTSAAYGQLILKNSSTLQEFILNEKTELSYDSVPVLWNPDSTSFLYEKNGNVYFCEAKASFQKLQISENYRKIGSGSINCFFWADSKSLYYVDRDLIYKINANELYTRALYSDVVGTGVVVGRLPVIFDEKRDSFSVDKSSSYFLLVQGKKSFSFFKIEGETFEYLSPIYSKIMTSPKGNIIGIKEFWLTNDKCLLWTDYLSFEASDFFSELFVFSFSNSSFKSVKTVKNAGKPILSPDSTKLCYCEGENLYVYNLSDLKLLDVLQGEKIISYVWGNNDTIYAGGESTVRQWKLNKNKEAGQKALNDEKSSDSKVLFLSSCKNVFWSSQTAICGEDVVKKDVFYDFDEVNGSWAKREQPHVQNEGSIQNGKYRVFLGETLNKKYSNSLYVRTVSGKAVTRAYFPETAIKGGNSKQISILIDALDDSSGLSEIILILKKYDIKATFFINGEFIRRYPKETSQIAKSGYDCASMFFTNADLTAKGFVVDEDFIRRGLARNEDEFFVSTGSELNLLWHAPFYKSNEKIKFAGKKSGYRYVEAGRFCLDTITLEESSLGKSGYLSAADLVEFYAENATEGSVIPVSTGISKGSRTDYLYEKLDLLIEALIQQGFEIVDLKKI